MDAKNQVEEVFVAANYFIKKAKSVSIMKLIKLAYISHGWHLAIYDRPLFFNRIEAWQYGPVIPDLYYASKYHGNGRMLDNVFCDYELPNDNTTEFLETCYKYYGGLSPLALSSLTHKEGTPWEDVYKEGERGTEISNEVIKKYYKNRMK